jgi:predicted ester cyclase
LRKAFPDIRFTIEQTVADAEMVVARWRAVATHQGEFLGAAPTNRRVEFTGMSMMKIVDGKIARGWDNWDQLALLTQIGAAPKATFLAA